MKPRRRKSPPPLKHSMRQNTGIVELGFSPSPILSPEPLGFMKSATPTFQAILNTARTLA